MIKFLDLYKQYLSIKDEIDEAIMSVIHDASFIGGKNLKMFEEHFAEYQKTKYCTGVGNGTDALEIALEALELPKGSEVIVPANTFIATAEAVTRAGHIVVFCDCNPDYTISIENAEKRMTPRTKAIIPVHLYGHPCDMDKVMEMAKKFGLMVIEDCAQAHGAEYKGKRVGGIGDVGAFSFYPGKNLGAYGDGGAILTNREDLAIKCRMIANHGRVEKYNHEFEGRNSRLDGLQAAVLNIKLKYLDTWIERRNEIACLYRNGLSEITGLILPLIQSEVRHAFHLFVIRTEHRNDLIKYLNESSIQTGIHYPISLPKLSAYKYLNQASEPMIANQYDSQILSLPMGEHLSDDEVLTVINKIKKFFNA